MNVYPVTQALHYIKTMCLLHTRV